MRGDSRSRGVHLTSAGEHAASTDAILEIATLLPNQTSPYSPGDRQESGAQHRQGRRLGNERNHRRVLASHRGGTVEESFTSINSQLHTYTSHGAGSHNSSHNGGEDVVMCPVSKSG